MSKGKIINLLENNDDPMVYVCPDCNNVFFFMVGSTPGLSAFEGFCCTECDLTFNFPEAILRKKILLTKGGDKMPLTETPLSDKEWQARSDAEALARANRISEDPKRLAAAKAAASKLAEEEKKDAAAMSKVAKGQKSRQPKQSNSLESVDIINFNVFQNVTKSKKE